MPQLVVTEINPRQNSRLIMSDRALKLKSMHQVKTICWGRCSTRHQGQYPQMQLAIILDDHHISHLPNWSKALISSASMTVVVKLSKFHNLSHQSKRRLKGKCSLKSAKKRSRTQLKISVTARQLLPWESNQIVYMQMRTNTFRRLDLLAQLCKSLLSGTISIVKLVTWKTSSRSVRRASAAM